MWPFGKRSTSVSASALHGPVFQSIIDALDLPPLCGSIRSVRSLNCSKSEAKETLLVLLRASSTEQARSLLRTAYLSISEFREMSEEEERALRAYGTMLSEASPEQLKRSLEANPQVYAFATELVAGYARDIANECESDRLTLASYGLAH